MFLSLTVPVVIVVIAVCPSEPSAWPWGQLAVTLHPTPPLSPHCRYEILTPNAIPKGFMDGKQACEKMVSDRWSASVCVCVCVCLSVCLHGLKWWRLSWKPPLSLPLLTTPPTPTDPSPRIGPQPLPRETKQDLLPGRCFGPARRRAGPEGHRYHRVLPGSCPGIPGSQVGLHTISWGHIGQDWFREG